MTAEMSNRVALVTGAGRGIGREIALGLAGAGAKVALLARSESELDAVASEIQSAEGTALALVADGSDPAQIGAAAARATSELGDIGLLVNNAGVVGPLGATSGLDPVDVSRSLAVNVAAVQDTGVTVNAYRPGAVDTAMQQWIRDQPPEQIGTTLHERFTANHARGNLITAHESAAALLSHLSTNDTGQIWDVNDNG